MGNKVSQTTANLTLKKKKPPKRVIREDHPTLFNAVSKSDYQGADDFGISYVVLEVVNQELVVHQWNAKRRIESWPIKCIQKYQLAGDNINTSKYLIIRTGPQCSSGVGVFQFELENASRAQQLYNKLGDAWDAHLMNLSKQATRIQELEQLANVRIENYNNGFASLPRSRKLPNHPQFGTLPNSIMLNNVKNSAYRFQIPKVQQQTTTFSNSDDEYCNVMDDSPKQPPTSANPKQTSGDSSCQFVTKLNLQAAPKNREEVRKRKSIKEANRMPHPPDWLKSENSSNVRQVLQPLDNHDYVNTRSSHTPSATTARTQTTLITNSGSDRLVKSSTVGGGNGSSHFNFDFVTTTAKQHYNENQPKRQQDQNFDGENFPTVSFQPSSRVPDCDYTTIDRNRTEALRQRDSLLTR